MSPEARGVLLFEEKCIAYNYMTPMYNVRLYCVSYLGASRKTLLELKATMQELERTCNSCSITYVKARCHATLSTRAVLKYFR